MEVSRKVEEAQSPDLFLWWCSLQDCFRFWSCCFGCHRLFLLSLLWLSLLTLFFLFMYPFILWHTIFILDLLMKLCCLTFKLRLGFGIGFVERRRESWGKEVSDWIWLRDRLLWSFVLNSFSNCWGYGGGRNLGSEALRGPWAEANLHKYIQEIKKKLSEM